MRNEAAGPFAWILELFRPTRSAVAFVFTPIFSLAWLGIYHFSLSRLAPRIPLAVLAGLGPKDLRRVIEIGLNPPSTCISWEAAKASLKAMPRKPATASTTFCNPLDLPYRFQPAPGLYYPESYREAADPTVVVYKDAYFLFASKSGGYWHSKDLVSWVLVEPQGLPLEDYAPTAMVMDGKMYFTASESQGIWMTDDPFEGIWRKIATIGLHWDPFLMWDKGKVYFAWGASNAEPIYIAEMLPSEGWRFASAPIGVVFQNQSFHGWEQVRPMINPLLGDSPFIEGAWINKVAGRYYLQYAGPGTELDKYGDGVYVSDESPLGPYRRDPHSPVSFKPSGFMPGAGHGSTFQDLQGRWWHIVTGKICFMHQFERRIMLFPAYFNSSDYPDHVGIQRDTTPSFLVDTYFGDSPIRLDQTKPAWQILSFEANTTSSSEFWVGEMGVFLPGRLAVDEIAHTWWSAGTCNPGEWLQLDLGAPAMVHAVQLNFADHRNTRIRYGLHDAYQYYVEWSLDAQSWNLWHELDRRDNTRDSPHDYVELASPTSLRYARITGVCCPAGMTFSLREFRLFGVGEGDAPDAVSAVKVKRSDADLREIKISWTGSARAQYYIVRCGLADGPLFHNYNVYGGDTSISIHDLSTDQVYTFAVDAVNPSGVTRGVRTVTA